MYNPHLLIAVALQIALAPKHVGDRVLRALVEAVDCRVVDDFAQRGLSR